MLTEDDKRKIREIRAMIKLIKDEQIVRDVTAIIEMAEVYLLKSNESQKVDVVNGELLLMGSELLANASRNG